MRFDRVIASFSPDADANVFARLQQSDPVGGKCLSQILLNALKTVKDRNTDPRLLAEYRMDLTRTLKEMQKTLERHDGAGNPPFVEKVLSLAVDEVGKKDLAIFGNLVDNARLEPLGLVPVHDIHLPQTEGVCHRAATKWAGCEALGVPFKYEGMKAGKIEEKMEDFFDFFKNVVLQSMQSGNGADAGADSAYNHINKEWLGKFTDGTGVPHHDAVTVEKLNHARPSDYLGKRPLAKGESLIVAYRAVKPNGAVELSHSLAVSGGEDPKLMCTYLRHAYRFTGVDIGKVLEEAVAMRFPPDYTFQWSLARVKANPQATAHG